MDINKFFFQLWKRQTFKLYGHVIRTKDDDPMSQVMFEPGTKVRKSIFEKRVGAPRLDWFNQTTKEAFNHFLPGAEYNDKTNKHYLQVRKNAQDRVGIFEAKPENKIL